jgi:uncharacterized protein (TIRG00374 family)
MLARREGMSTSTSLGTVLVERLFDGFTLLLVLVLGLMGSTFRGEWHSMETDLRAVGITLFVSYIALIILLACFKYRPQPFIKLLDGLLFFLPKSLRSRAVDMLRNFGLGLAPARDFLRLSQAIFYSILLWACSLCQIHLVEYSLGWTLPFISTFVVLAMASFGAMIPSAPAFVGTFHLAVQYGFLFYGVEREEALSAAIIWHAGMFFPTVLVGIILFLCLPTISLRPK